MSWHGWSPSAAPSPNSQPWMSAPEATHEFKHRPSTPRLLAVATSDPQPRPAQPRVSSGAVFFDSDDRLLLVKPTYKDGWNLPGGAVDAGETPREACVREVREELGIEPPVGPLLLTAWTRSSDMGDKVFLSSTAESLTHTTKPTSPSTSRNSTSTPSSRTQTRHRHWRSQTVSASAASISAFSSTSAGVLNPSVFRGLRFSFAAISSSSV